MRDYLRHFAALLVLPSSLCAGDYSLESATFDGGGGKGASANYGAQVSMAAGGADHSPAFTARTGYIGRLPAGIPVLLRLAAGLSTVDEESTRQVDAELINDDGTTTAIPGSTVTWSIQSGPLASIDADGLVTAGAVYEDSTATIRGLHQSLEAGLELTVLEVIGDNFRTYAGDLLPDDWQVRYLGVDHPDAAPGEDGDNDGKSNLIEFGFGTNPGSGASGAGDLEYVGTLAGSGSLAATGMPVLRFEPSGFGVDYRALFVRRKDFASHGLVYTPQFSADLMTWKNGTGTVQVLAEDGDHQIVSIRYPFFVSGRKTRFFRVGVSLTP